jgi:penicillin-binding protein 1A
MLICHKYDNIVIHNLNIMTNFFDKFIKSLFILFILGLSFVFLTLWYFSFGLPDYKKLENYEPPIISRVYSDSGDLVAEYGIEKRLFVPYEFIPKNIINSFLSAEDKNFFSHPGIDAKGILRAVIKNLSNILADKRLEGASTITQQVAKNFLLTNEVSLKRKIKEAILAFRIEKALTKKRILELYLNQIYLGEGSYGIAAASLEYFDKSIQDLDYSESALLAALPKAPSRYNPFKYPEIAKFRRDLVLNNLYENDFISNEKLKEFKSLPINLKKRNLTIYDESYSYVEEVRRVIKEKYGFDELYTQGLAIRSPINIQYQKSALKSLRDGLEAYDKRHGWRGALLNTNGKNISEWRNILQNKDVGKYLNWDLGIIEELSSEKLKVNLLNRNYELTGSLIEIQQINNKWISDDFEKKLNIGEIIYLKKIINKSSIEWVIKQYPEVNGAIVVIENKTGNVKALVGGYNSKISEFNRATQAMRQPGSAFKPFIYAAALMNGYASNSIVMDTPFVIDQGIGLKTWKPENYGKEFYGPTTLRKGLEYSRNLMTVRIAQDIGMEKIKKLSEELGIYKNLKPLLSGALGSNETTLLNLTAAYSIFANGGSKVETSIIDTITDRHGKNIYLNQNITCLDCEKAMVDNSVTPILDFNSKRAIDNATAYQILSMLEGVVKRGTGKKLNYLNVPLAGKTGTTNKNTDAFFIGLTSDLAIGVYVGFDAPKTLGKYETGSKAALPIFEQFIKDALNKDDFKKFQIPVDINFASIDYDTGEFVGFKKKRKSITESFKDKDLYNINYELENNVTYENLKKFRQFY